MIGITITDGQGNTREVELDLPRIRLGRADDNDVVLDSPACSRHHAEIVQKLGAYQMVDLGSTNGIRVGETRVPDLFLTDGATVAVGDHTLTFSIQEAAHDQTVLLSSPLRPPAEPLAPEPSAEPASLYLVFRQGGGKRSLKIVAGARYVIGRSPDADLVVEDSRASKRHARIDYEVDGFVLTDLGSSNGTRLNGRQVTKGALAAGDEIVIGRQTIAVQDQRLDLEDEATLLGKTRYGLPVLPEADGPLEEPTLLGGDRQGGRRLGPALLAIAIALLAVGAALVWRGRRAEQPAVEPPAAARSAPAAGAQALVVRTAPVETRMLARSVEGSGSIRPHRTVRVSAEIPGQVLAVFVEEGARVEAGDLLAHLDDSDLRLQIEEARSAVSKDRVDLAKDEWARMQRLLDQGVVSRSVVDRSKGEYLALQSAYESTQAKIRQLQEQLRKAAIQAPLAGRVAHRFVNQGEFLAPGGPVALLENMDEVLVELEVSDRDIVKVQPGQIVEATTDAFPGRVFRGLVDSTATAASPVTRTFKVEARIDNRDGSLRSGMIAALRVLLEERRATVIPAEALIDPGDGTAAVFLAADGVARLRAVEVGERWDRDVEVLSGLAPGDQVIVSGQERLEDGGSVQVYRGD